MIFTFKKYENLKEIRKSDPILEHKHYQTIRWLKITLTSWILGFIFLAVTLFILEKNNLLINHIKGIF